MYAAPEQSRTNVRMRFKEMRRARLTLKAAGPVAPIPGVTLQGGRRSPLEHPALPVVDRPNRGARYRRSSSQSDFLPIGVEDLSPEEVTRRYLERKRRDRAQHGQTDVLEDGAG
jgi:hypothetical protein